MSMLHVVSLACNEGIQFFHNSFLTDTSFDLPLIIPLLTIICGLACFAETILAGRIRKER